MALTSAVAVTVVEQRVAFAADPAGVVTEYSIPTANSGANHPVLGPDGNVWFLETLANKVAKVTPAGFITEFPIPTADSDPHHLVVGADGNLWFSEGGLTKRGGNAIAKVTTAGVVTEYPIPTTNEWCDCDFDGAWPSELTVGPDGNLWFAETNPNPGLEPAVLKVAKITPTGAITEYPTPNIPTSGLTPGPDGNLWFTEIGPCCGPLTYLVAKVTPTGAVTEYTPPEDTSPNSRPTVGPDGNLWFATLGGGGVNDLLKVTTAGDITPIPLSGEVGGFRPIVGPDGNIWINEFWGGAVAKVTTDGDVTEYPVPCTVLTGCGWNSGFPGQLTAGPDGNVWFPQGGGPLLIPGKVTRITPNGQVTEYPPPTPAGVGQLVIGSDRNLWFSTASNNVAKIGTAGPPASLAFTTQPASAPAGTNLPTQPIVTVRDAHELTVSASTASVSLTIAQGTGAAGAILSCNSNPVSAVAGVATFAGCKIDKAGSGYRLTAVDNTNGLAVTSASFDIAAAPPATPTPDRVSGQDAIATAIAISQAQFPSTGSASTNEVSIAATSASAVVLARSDFFSDALAGGPLAAKVDASLLISPGSAVADTLDPRVLAEIQRLISPGQAVYILGGPLAISTDIDATLTGLGYTVVRVFGADQYATAVEIAKQIGSPNAIFEATGVNFPDALSAVPAAIKSNGVILLTNGNQQAPATQAYIDAHPSVPRYAIGGPLVAAGADPNATAVYGADLYATSAAVANTFFPRPSVFGIATGANFPDALAGGVFMATGGRMGPLVLVPPALPIPTPVTAYLHTLTKGTPSYAFGGPLAISAGVLSAVQAAVG